MEIAGRITRITTSTSSGSGYVIAPRLVLTSAHVVPKQGNQVQVSTATDHRPRIGQVVWRGTPRGHDDAALVEIVDPGWDEQTVITRWGRLVTNSHSSSCQVWGFPDLVQRSDRAAETSQQACSVMPGDQYVNHRYVINLSANPPRWSPREVRQQEQAGHQRSLWAGLSGSAMRCGEAEMVTGVVAADLQNRDHSALECVPAYVLHDAVGFRSVLEKHHVPMILEPVELAPLDSKRTEFNDSYSPADLLEPHQQVVPFHGRSEAIQNLLAWANNKLRTAVMIIHGPGGSGKSRLAYELTQNVNANKQEWSTVWVSHDTTVHQLQILKDTRVPLLLVIDYAETRAEQIAEVLKACSHRSSPKPVRLLLLSRTVGEWRNQVNNRVSGALDNIATTHNLSPLISRPEDRRLEYHIALKHHVKALNRIAPKQFWRHIADQLSDPLLEGQEWETVLSLHMRALADLLDAAQTSLSQQSRVPVEERILTHEKRYWETSAIEHGLFSPSLWQPLQDALAIAFTFTASTPDRADELLDKIPEMADQTKAYRIQLRRWIASLYPTQNSNVWGQLQPDRILELFLGQRLIFNPSLFDPYIECILSADAKRMVTLSTRAAAHATLSGLEEQLTRWCKHHTGNIGEAVIFVATQVENPEPLIRALENTASDPVTSLETLDGLRKALPKSSQRLAEWAAQLTTRIVEEKRNRFNEDPITHRPELAESLKDQSTWLSQSNKPNGALEAINEAVKHYRKLQRRNRGEYRTKLASTLNNKANHLGELGYSEKALKIINQAVDVYREIFEIDNDGHRADLAASLNNQANRMGDLEKKREALEIINEAVSHYQHLADRQPDSYLPQFARSLNNKADHLKTSGYPEEALKTVNEAIDIYHSLVEPSRSSHLPELAKSLHNKADYLRDMNYPREALEAIERAIIIQTTLTSALPAAHKEDLKESLRTREHLMQIRFEE